MSDQLQKAAAATLIKMGGWKSELATGFNPLNVVGSPIGTLAAAVTPTRSMREVAEADLETWKNVLMPGRGMYNVWKRHGTEMRGPERWDGPPGSYRGHLRINPEMEKLRLQIQMERLEAKEKARMGKLEAKAKAKDKEKEASMFLYKVATDRLARKQQQEAARLYDKLLDVLS